jgi:hypothetical protein
MVVVEIEEEAGLVCLPKKSFREDGGLELSAMGARRKERRRLASPDLNRAPNEKENRSISVSHRRIRRQESDRTYWVRPARIEQRSGRWRGCGGGKEDQHRC